MRKAVVLLVAFMALVSINEAQAESLTDFYTPYGFRLPPLRQGQYILSGGLVGYISDYSSSYSDGYSQDSDNSDLELEGQAIYALTDQLCVRLGLSFVPNQDYGSSEYCYGDGVCSKNEDDLEAAFNPEVEVVFRPLPNLAVYGTYYASSREIETRDTSSGVIPYVYRRTEHRSAWFSAGVVLLGGPGWR